MGGICLNHTRSIHGLETGGICLFVLRVYSPVIPMGIICLNYSRSIHILVYWWYLSESHKIKTWFRVPVSLTLCCFVVYSTRRFVLCLTLCYFVLVFFSPFSIAVTSLGEERANLSAFCMFVWFALVWFCLFPLPLGVWERLRFVTLPGLFSYLFFFFFSDSWYLFVCVEVL